MGVNTCPIDPPLHICVQPIIVVELQNHTVRLVDAFNTRVKHITSKMPSVHLSPLVFQASLIFEIIFRASVSTPNG